MVGVPFDFQDIARLDGLSQVSKIKAALALEYFVLLSAPMDFHTLNILQLQCFVGRDPCKIE